MSARHTLHAVSSICLAWLGTFALAAELEAGLAIGAPTASIPVLDITGNYAGKRICYVCEFQDAPNVLAFFQQTGDETAELIRQLDRLYVANKDDDFHAVAMIVAGPEASDWLLELDAASDLEIPLTVFNRGPRDVAARLYELDPEVPNTFLVTRNRFVVANISGIGPGGFTLVEDATHEMLAAD